MTELNQPSWFKDEKIDYGQAPAYFTKKKELLDYEAQHGGIKFNSRGHLDANASTILYLLAAGDIKLDDFRQESLPNLIIALTGWYNSIQDKIKLSGDSQSDISEFELWQMESARRLLIELDYLTKKNRPIH